MFKILKKKSINKTKEVLNDFDFNLKKFQNSKYILVRNIKTNHLLLLENEILKEYPMIADDDEQIYVKKDNIEYVLLNGANNLLELLEENDIIEIASVLTEKYHNTCNKIIKVIHSVYPNEDSIYTQDNSVFKEKDILKIWTFDGLTKDYVLIYKK